MEKIKRLKFRQLVAKVAKLDTGKGKRELNITEIGRILRILKSECKEDADFLHGLLCYLGATIGKN